MFGILHMNTVSPVVIAVLLSVLLLGCGSEGPSSYQQGEALAESIYNDATLPEDRARKVLADHIRAAKDRAAFSQGFSDRATALLMKGMESINAETGGQGGTEASVREAVEALVQEASRDAASTP